jgi:hypothetical protein
MTKGRVAVVRKKVRGRKTADLSASVEMTKGRVAVVRSRGQGEDRF